VDIFEIDTIAAGQDLQRSGDGSNCKVSSMNQTENPSVNAHCS
jgi:hypothetical protein